MSDIDELVKQVDEACNWNPHAKPAPLWPHRLLHDCRSALTALAAENERLREALGAIAKSPVKAWDRDGDLYATGMNDGREYCANIARAALTGKENPHD